MRKPSTLRPGLMVYLRTSVTGNVQYRTKTLAPVITVNKAT